MSACVCSLCKCTVPSLIKMTKSRDLGEFQTLQTQGKKGDQRGSIMVLGRYGFQFPGNIKDSPKPRIEVTKIKRFLKACIAITDSDFPKSSPLQQTRNEECVNKKDFY